MKILSVEAHNFGSYAHVKMDLADLGLILLHGATGSGKSTIFDMVSWSLYGVTAKGGRVDEVVSWKSTIATQTTLFVEVKGVILKITRIRGSAQANDLYFSGPTDVLPVRGKDTSDTQKLLNARLGVTPELYLSACYLSEFSPTASFFTATAQNRRHLLDLIADTELPTKLVSRAQASKKTTKPQQLAAEKELYVHKNSIKHHELRIKELGDYASSWDNAQQASICELEVKSKNFETIKKSKIDALTTKSEVWLQEKQSKLDGFHRNWDKLRQKLSQFDTIGTELSAITVLISNWDKKCPTCGTAKFDEECQKLEDKRKKLSIKLSERSYVEDSIEDYKKRYQFEQRQSNPYELDIIISTEAVNDYYNEQLRVKNQINPYNSKFIKLKEQEVQLNEQLQVLIVTNDRLLNKLELLDELQGICKTLRASLVQNSVSEVQNTANSYMERFFDAEIRITLTPTEDDSLEVDIRKNGYECVYTQLSKGQRQLLKLCFSLAVMKASANKVGIHFDNLFLDESLDGLDTRLKNKAYSLLEELSLTHGTVMVIDHSEDFKSSFINQLRVDLVNDESVIT